MEAFTNDIFTNGKRAR